MLCKSLGLDNSYNPINMLTTTHDKKAKGRESQRMKAVNMSHNEPELRLTNRLDDYCARRLYILEYSEKLY